MRHHGAWIVCCMFGFLAAIAVPPAQGAVLQVGASTVSITPDQPVALSGQMSTRIAREVQSVLLANALALESQNEGAALEQVIFVACDVVAIPEHIRTRAIELLAPRVPDFDTNKLIISATHTHTAPVMIEGVYVIPDEDVMRPAEFSEFFSARIADVAEAAWKNRKPARAGWGMGDAVVAYNRRSFFEDGHAQMYGNISIDEFRGIEGPEDHAVEVLFFWDEDDSLIATAVNIACTAQEVEGLSVVNADFWHPVREGLKAKHGEGLVVLGWIGAAGDQSPHIRFRQAAEDRMRELRGLSRLDEIARRIIRAWEEAYEGGQKEKFSDVPLVHTVKSIELPQRLVTEQEYKDTQAEIAAASTDPRDYRRVEWLQNVLKRYEQQQQGDIGPYTMDLHVLRLGDVAIAVNPFELFTQYGIQMKAKSKALHTFVIELAGPGTYVPTPFAAAGGGYSAIAASNQVGPEGGQKLVDETVAAVNALWSEQ
ncbi:MAG TPA: hypothetical protein PLD73_03990 [Candidatus Hydrogenedentes bacterium]|nr:hypothetical protein [Candidatus Hydrogenedentota bacterium]HPJ99195.1 hypothetical protein [Candidatus Hydrogenedentota bacterium]